MYVINVYVYRLYGDGYGLYYGGNKYADDNGGGGGDSGGGDH